MRGAVFHDGDALEQLREMRAKSVHCACTSPPYLGLRDYECAGQVGLERTPREYVDRLVAIFGELRRVLRDDGTLWLVLGDSFANDKKWGGSTGGKHARGLHGATGVGRQKKTTGLKSKDLIGVPWMVAFALRDAGWYLRSDIVWAKKNPMCESVQDRPTRAHETVFLLTKSASYYYDAHAISEPAVTGDHKRNGTTSGAWKAPGQSRQNGISKRRTEGAEADYQTRNVRDVWVVATQPFPEAHFAVMPEEIARRAILAGTSEDGCCAACGAPRVRQLARTKMVVRESPRRAAVKRAATGSSSRTQVTGTMTEAPSARTVGWRAGCKCDAATVPCVVLDPFSGAGTTGLVALKNGRRFVGIELNPAYIEMAERRIRNKMRGRP